MFARARAASRHRHPRERQRGREAHCRGGRGCWALLGPSRHLWGRAEHDARAAWGGEAALRRGPSDRRRAVLQPRFDAPGDERLQCTGGLRTVTAVTLHPDHGSARGPYWYPSMTASGPACIGPAIHPEFRHAPPGGPRHDVDPPGWGRVGRARLLRAAPLPTGRGIGATRSDGRKRPKVSVRHPPGGAAAVRARKTAGGKLRSARVGGAAEGRARARGVDGGRARRPGGALEACHAVQAGSRGRQRRRRTVKGYGHEETFHGPGGDGGAAPWRPRGCADAVRPALRAGAQARGAGGAPCRRVRSPGTSAPPRAPPP